MKEEGGITSQMLLKGQMKVKVELMEVTTVLKNVVAMEFPRWTWHSAGERDRLQDGASRQMLGQRRLLSKMPGVPGHRGASGGRVPGICAELPDLGRLASSVGQCWVPTMQRTEAACGPGLAQEHGI